MQCPRSWVQTEPILEMTAPWFTRHPRARVQCSGDLALGDRAAISDGAAFRCLLDTYLFVDLRTTLLICLLQQAREVFDAGGISVAH